MRAFDRGMGCQDLLDQGRTGARQAHDEDRIRVRGATVPVARKQLRGADGDLQAGVALEQLRLVLALGALERVAARVVFERLLILLPVLECLAQRKAQVAAIDGRRGWRGLGGAHRTDFLLGEAVGLQVREAPVSVAEAGARGGGRAVLSDGFLAPAQGLERVGNREMKFRRLRGPDEQAPVQLNGLLELSEAHAGQRVERAVVPIGRIHGKEPFGLLPRLRVQTAFVEHLRVLEAGLGVIRRQVEHGLE